MGCLDRPFFFATDVTTAKRPVNAQPSSDIGASPQPTRRGPNQGFWPMIGVIRIPDHRARGWRQQSPSNPRANGGFGPRADEAGGDPPRRDGRVAGRLGPGFLGALYVTYLFSSAITASISTS